MTPFVKGYAQPVRAAKIVAQHNDGLIVINHASTGNGHCAVIDVDALRLAKLIEAQGREDTFIPVWGHQAYESLFVEHLDNDERPSVILEI